MEFEYITVNLVLVIYSTRILQIMTVHLIEFRKTFRRI